MEELGAVLDATDVTEPIVEDGAEPIEPVEPAEPAGEVKEETPGDWRKVPENLKAFFKTAEGKAAKDAWFERNAYKEKFPEGIKQVNELTAFLDEHGGREGLTTALGELTGKAAELDGIASKMASGDPSLITDFAQNSPDGFAKIAPVVAEQWAKVDPEGWGAAMSGVMAATIASNGVPMFLEKMGMLLEFGKTEDAMKMLGDLKGWAGSFGQKAVAPRTEMKQQASKDDGRAAFEKEKQDFFISKIRDEADATFRTPMIAKELESFAKRRPNDTEAKDLAISTVRSQVMERMKADSGYQKSLTAFTSRGDKEGAMKLLKSREAAAIAEIAPKVGRMIFGNPGAAAAAAAKTAAISGSKPEAGFTTVDKAPAPQLIDRFRTTDAMIMRGQFILKDGRKMALEG
jgi:hypothetical protein